MWWGEKWYQKNQKELREMENIISKMENSIHGLNGRLDISGEMSLRWTLRHTAEPIQMKQREIRWKKVNRAFFTGELMSNGLIYM